MKKRLLLATCAWLLTLSGTVYSQGPATVAVGGVVAGEFLDKAESSANRLMEQARTEADYVLFQFAQNMLMLIQRARGEAADLIDKAVGDLGNQRNALFYQIDELLRQAETNLAEAYAKADELTANFAQVVADLPITSDEAQLFTVQPAVLPPLAIDTIVTFLGPNMGNANAVATLPDGKKIQLTTFKSSNAYLKLKPLDYASADGSARFTEIRIDYVKKPDTFWTSPGWDGSEMASLTAPIAVPPKVPGKVRLVQLLQDKATEAMTFDVIVHHMGKNTEGYKVVKVPPEYLPLGWRINTEKVRTKKIVTGSSGHTGSCNGVAEESITPEGFAYKVWAGSGQTGLHKYGGNQNCHLRVPLVRNVVKQHEEIGDFQDLSWADPVYLSWAPTAVERWVEIELPGKERRRLSPGEALMPVTISTETDGKYRVMPVIPRTAQLQ
jgi:hypothetical protein